MRKPLTLFETLFAALLAAILFSNLLGNLFLLTKTKKKFSNHKTSVLSQAALHTRLKELGDASLTYTEQTLYFEETPIATDVSTYGVEWFYNNNGILTRSEEKPADKPCYAIRYTINEIPYTILLGNDREGFELCK